MKWIWLPSQRTLANTFVLFRHTVNLKQVPEKVSGWITADSRYKLTVNGRRVQWGPAPFDPRHAELDPVEIPNDFWMVGENVIGVEVLFYGHGEGSWPFGKPGLMLSLPQLEVQSDNSWRCRVDRGHRPGQYKRWYLRSLQEVFDARLHPFGWNMPGFEMDAEWVPAQELNVPMDRAVFSGGYSDYMNELWMSDPAESTLRPRAVPMMDEVEIQPIGKSEAQIKWHRHPDNWFENRSPDSWSLTELTEGPEVGRLITYEFHEGLVGWPWFEVIAPEGTVIEVMVQENHDPAATSWLETSLFAWSRFTCREGGNYLEPFDFEAFKWVQLHIWNDGGKARVIEAGARRRLNPVWDRARWHTSDEKLATVFEAAFNTVKNSAQDTIVDGMARERQQYAGDGSHQLVPLRLSSGDYELPRRFLRTYGYGQLTDGVWLDSWPAYDRLARIWEREVGASYWGPLVDHSIGFCLDHYYHWMESGEIEPAIDNWPRLMKFVEYLRTIRDSHGLLKVEDIGINAVWIDHDAYKQQRHKQCAFNLYAAAMLNDGLGRLAPHIEPSRTAELQDFAADLVEKTVDRFYDHRQDLLIVNRPWLDEEREERLCDRSLATAILFDQIPMEEEAGKALKERPSNLGISYPANALWRFHALAKVGEIQTVIDELRSQWADMRSVKTNKTIQEMWDPRPDTAAILSHCAVAPLTTLYRDIVGIKPAAPGYRKVTVEPQLGDIPDLDLTLYTPQGPIRFKSKGAAWDVELPPSISKVMDYC
jgi:alpha-L-rhamnosidase